MTQTKIGVGMISATSIGDAKVLQGDGSWVTPSAGALTFINTSDLSSAATYDFTAVNASSYDGYGFFLHNVIPATDDVHFYARTSTDAGSSYDSGSSDYAWGTTSWGIYSSDSADTHINLIDFQTSAGFSVGSAANEPGCSGWIWLIAPHLTGYTVVQSVLSAMSDNAVMMTFASSGCRLSAADVDAFQLLFSSGAIESGTITAYGVANA